MARIARNHVPKHLVAIRVRAGERVSVGREDDEFPGWFWCQAADGRCSWVPNSLVERVGGGAGVMREDYDARELAVTEGEQVTVERRLLDWCLVRNAAGERGWIPESHLDSP